MVTGHIPSLYKCSRTYPLGTSRHSTLKPPPSPVSITALVPHLSPCLCAETPGLCPTVGWILLGLKVERLPRLLLLGGRQNSSQVLCLKCLHFIHVYPFQQHLVGIRSHSEVTPLEQQFESMWNPRDQAQYTSWPVHGESQGTPKGQSPSS